MTHLYAYSFHAPFALAQVLQRLQDLGGLRWIERDNDRWGAYVSARALRRPHDGFVKLICDEGRYIINVYLRSDEADAGEAFAAVRDQIFHRVLPALDASDIRKCDDLES